MPEFPDTPEFDAKIAGQEVRTRGYRTMDLIALLATVAFFAMIYILYTDFKTTTNAQAAQSSTEHKTLAENVTRMDESINEQTYVMTLSQKEKEALDLRMPDSLRRKLRRDR